MIEKAISSGASVLYILKISLPTSLTTLIQDILLCFYNIIYIEYLSYSLKHNNSFILRLKLHKIRATSFGVLPSAGPSQN